MAVCSYCRRDSQRDHADLYREPWGGSRLLCERCMRREYPEMALNGDPPRRDEADEDGLVARVYTAALVQAASRNGHGPSQNGHGPGQAVAAPAPTVPVSARLDSAVVNLVQLIQEGIPEREWLPASEGLLAAGRRHLCAAPAKTGKSLAWLVHAVNIVLAGGSVVILDRENGAEEYARRLSDVLEAKDASEADWAAVDKRLTYCQWPLVRMTDAEREDYVAWLKARAGLVIFDSSRKFLDHLALGESSSDDYGQFMDALVDPLMAAGVATLILDNTGHEETGRARGTSSKADLQEVVLTLEQAEPFDYFTAGRVALNVTHTRLGDSGSRWLMKLGGGTYGAFAAVQGSAPLPEKAQRLVDALGEQPQSDRTLGEQVGMPKTTALRWLRKLAREGLARQVSGGWTSPLPGVVHSGSDGPAERTTSNDAVEPNLEGWSAVHPPTPPGVDHPPAEAPRNAVLDHEEEGL
jgi:AAA domain/IclR helix-turn-helix domain